MQLKFKLLYLFLILLYGCKTNNISKIDFKPSEHISDLKNELQNQEIKDYFFVQHIQYGTIRVVKNGFRKRNVCLPNSTYYSLYAFWKKNNINYIQKFDNCGVFKPVVVSSSIPFEYYEKHTQDIIQSKVKQYQTGVNEFTDLTHQPLRYFWFINENQMFTSNFDKFDLTTSKNKSSFVSKPNLNYESNRNEPIVKLNSETEKLISELSQKNEFQRK